MIDSVALLFTAMLFGGMTLFSGGFAGVLFRTLPAAEAGRVLRAAFPRFYLFVIVAAMLAAALLWPADPLGSAALAVIALTTVPTRQLLMPAINRATDTGETRRFGILHGVSVVITVAHIIVAGWVLTRFLG